MNPDSSVFVAGSQGLVGSAIVRNLEKKNYDKIYTQDWSKNWEKDYVKAYAKAYSQNFTGDFSDGTVFNAGYTGSTNYSGAVNYTKTYEGPYLGSFVPTYTGDGDFVQRYSGPLTSVHP